MLVAGIKSRGNKCLPSILVKHNTYAKNKELYYGGFKFTTFFYFRDKFFLFILQGCFIGSSIVRGHS